MTDDWMSSMSEDEFDVRLARYLQWESGQLRGTLNGEEATKRITREAQRPRWTRNAALAWAAIAIALLLSVSLLIFGGGSGPVPNLVVASASPSAHLSPVESISASASPSVHPSPVEPISATAGPSSTPIVGVGPCRSDRIDIQPAPTGAAVPAAATSIQVPPGGRIAMALEEGAGAPDRFFSSDRGSIVIAGPDAGSVRVIATFTGQDIQAPGGVHVSGWSPNGDALQVWAGHDSRNSDEFLCGNLFLVQADGSGVRRLTDNGPGDWVQLSAFGPSGTTIAYTQSNVLNIVSPDGGRRAIPFGECPLERSMQWAPDAGRILLDCDVALRVVDLETAKDSLISLPSESLDARWSADGRTIVAAVGDDVPGLIGGPLTILEIDPDDGTTRTSRQSDGSAEWVLGAPTLSPDGRWLLVEGGGDTSPPYYPTYLVDTATGVTTKLPWPVLTDHSIWTHLDQLPGAIWLDGNDRVLSNDGGTLYEVDLLRLTRTKVGSVPARDFAWFAMPR